MWADSSSRPEGPIRSRRRRSPPAGLGCSRSRRVVGRRPPRIWPGARAYRASRANALGLALAGTRAGEWSAWMRSAAKEWLEIASTSGICVALQRMRRFGRFGPPKGCWSRTQVGEFGVHHSILNAQGRQKAAFAFSVNYQAIRSSRRTK